MATNHVHEYAARAAVEPLVRMPREFFARSAPLVAPDLLGCVLVHKTEDGITAGIITETEAYAGITDKACHAYGGRRTKRNETMYGPPGTAYVYFTYGMHYCFNIVVAEVDVPHAVLVRSVFPILGIDLMLRRRKGKRPLAEGPGRLTQAMGISKEHNGADLVADNLYVARPESGLPSNLQIETAPRVGIAYAEEARYYHWRYFINLRED